MLSWFNRTKHPADGHKELAPEPVEQKPVEQNAASEPPLHPIVDASETLAPPPVIPDRTLTRTPSPITVPSAIPPPSPTREQPKKRAFTAALNTPHDAVLAELQDHHPGHDPSARIDPPASPSSLPPAPPQPETLYDPFTGAQMGQISPLQESARQEDLWVHLARIRELQAAVAGMHVTMEGIGMGDLAIRGAGVRSRSGVGERLEDEHDRVDEDDDEEGEEARRVQRDKEFDQSEQRFLGRKEEIDRIMEKLSALSDALATFHALDTPTVDFTAASRTNTVASTAMPVPLAPAAVRRRPEVRRLASDASHASDFFLESPMSMQAPLPTVEEPEGGADLAPYSP
ncbi:hypothetical protein BV25DRAFT_1986942 [Artomyces pyxidatus]|uniref:Uncharacterized protein n=1 Tax=Artomyces pyxidatus TaxID=48021 RepID=A0ACB8TI34_9AGAM|nr:hypothetical protein BV25DRAFT_1986942 [Artomyces pyxidatus]